jgi:hypothetical protein
MPDRAIPVIAVRDVLRELIVAVVVHLVTTGLADIPECRNPPTLP